ncbi:MAG: DNA-directed RNA polymerase subunit omega [Candidatus Omnitrophota bacterium]
MSYVPLEKLIDKSDGSMYKLVMMSARRAIELADGAARLIEAPQDLKVTTLALREIAEAKVSLGKAKEEKKDS